MDLHLKDNVAFVAGSSRGIGRAIAQGFLAEGARVVVTGRAPDIVRSTVTSLAQDLGAQDRLLGAPGDLLVDTDRTATLEQTRDRWGGVDHLVANIGSGKGKVGWELNPDDWNDLFSMNLWSAVRMVESTLAFPFDRKLKSIILISSIAGLETTNAPLPYSAAKAALVTYSKGLAKQLGPEGVRVNCVAPGNILFPGGSWERRLAKDRETVERYIATEVATRRFGQPEEIANLVVFLASDRASFMTGSCIVADGGQTRGFTA